MLIYIKEIKYTNPPLNVELYVWAMNMKIETKNVFNIGQRVKSNINDQKFLDLIKKKIKNKDIPINNLGNTETNGSSNIGLGNVV